MSGYQTFEALRPILYRGPPPMPVVDRALIAAKPAPVVVAPITPAQAAPAFVSTKQVKRMRALRAEGMSLRAIGRLLGVTHSTVLRYAKDVPEPAQGWATGGRARRFSRDAAQRMYRAGFTLREIADNYGVSHSAAYYAVNERKPGNPYGRRRVNRLVERVARASKIPAASLRAVRQGPVKKGDAGNAKARALMFWLVYRQLAPVSSRTAGASLGGFSGTTVMDGVRRTDAAIAALGLTIAEPKDMVRTLWRAEWPARECRLAQ